MKTTKDSQDWLDEILDKMLAEATDGESYDWPDSFRGAWGLEIREHILQEALGMIGEDDRDYSGDNTDHDSKIFLVASSTACNELRQELRNKFNDKYKEG